ncbi:hypothetical protein [Paenibacillus glycanilyticus]|uniref:Uncharacterized protein n=1 Tax=Paenibacillus glycanilyticus TaxID=126569 RepID=A0ABQ6G5L8_9BACL|nr:hypothetical protein [Paenibacillus glycanilyticus]GLX66268.1 hypothetical protein MU1_06120 [Paenibacillus glycanilyticus]
MTSELEVYVVLTDTGTLFTRTIKWFTKDQLNHASIAFDSGLNEVYSFGRKNPQNPFFAGFVKENMRGQLFAEATCALYRCRMQPAAYTKMRSVIAEMEHNRELYRYNLIGVIGLLFNTQLIKREYAYFCSEFVASVFEKSGVELVNKSSFLVTPGDLENTPKLELVYEGRLQDLLNTCIQEDIEKRLA